MIKCIFTPVIRDTLRLSIKKANPDREEDDRVHYFIPKSKHHTLNFQEDTDVYGCVLQEKQRVQLIDGEGVIRIETKNTRGSNFTTGDSAYVFSRLPRVYPPVGESGGWVSIPITDINFDDYTNLRNSKSSSRLVDWLREGAFGCNLATHGWLENVILTFTRPLTDEEIKVREEKEKNSPFRTLRKPHYSDSAIYLLHDGEGYFVKAGGEIKGKEGEEKIKSKEWRLVANINLSTYQTPIDVSFDPDLRATVFLGLHCINHDDLIAVFGDKTEFIKVEQFDQLDASHFANYGKLAEGKHYRDQKFHLAIIHDGEGHYILYRPSRSDITNLDHTLTLLRKAIRHDPDSDYF